MTMVEIYIQEWLRIFLGFLDFGFCSNDIHFHLVKDQSGKRDVFTLEISSKLFRLLGKATSSGEKEFQDFLDSIENHPTRSNTVKLYLCGIGDVSLFQGVIRSGLSYLREKAKKAREDNGKRICREKDEIRDRAKILSIKAIREKNNPHYHKRDKIYVLWVDLGSGEERLTGKCPNDIIQEIERLLDK